MVTFPSLCWKQEGFFSEPHCENLVGAPGGKTHKSGEGDLKLSPQEFLTLKLVHTLPPAVCQLQ